MSSCYLTLCQRARALSKTLSPPLRALSQAILAYSKRPPHIVLLLFLDVPSHVVEGQVVPLNPYDP